MLKSIRYIIAVLILVISAQVASGQFGIGLTFSDDLYNIYNNEEDSIAYRRNGSALLNPALGPKIWIGGDKFSISVEAQANLGILGLALKDYKGLGSVSFPMMAKLNFGGLSGLNKDMGFGMSVGGGIQYSKTELYGLTDEYRELGVTRDYFKTFNIQLAGGMGISGFTAQLFSRFGFNPDLNGVPQ